MIKLRRIIGKVGWLKRLYVRWLQYKHSRLLKNECIKELEYIKKYSGCFNEGSLASLRYSIAMEYHRVEKGLNMPSFRPGFGSHIILNLTSLVMQYYKKTSCADLPFEVRHAVSVLEEYRIKHEQLGFELQKDVNDALAMIGNNFEIPASCQKKVTREQYWSKLNSVFDEFSASRHSVREFVGRVDASCIVNSVELACNAPSACNRQYVHVHFFDDVDTVQKILSLQNGNRGFGHLAEQLLIVSADISGMRWFEERHDIYTNAGIFIMNLSYALHYNKVAHCILNWSESSEKSDRLRKLASIPNSEVIVALIICGEAPELIKLASSPRKSSGEILLIHKH